MYSVNLAGVATQSLVSIGTNVSSENASIQNASITSLSVVDFKSATFSPQTLNTSVLNISTINIDPNFVFPVLNVSTLNSIEESFVNVSAVNISANQITADNIQPLLTAGDNISILNNTISALNNNLPATGNFTTLNTSQINASNLSTGDLTFGSNFTLSNKFLTVNSTTNITENSGDLVTSGAVYNALNKFSTNLSDARSLTNTKLIAGGDVIKPIVPFTTNTIKTNVDPGTSQNIMKVFYTTKFGANAMLSATANFGYEVSGFGTDRITARLEYNNGATNNIGQQEQYWDRDEGGGTRSGVLSPRQGVRVSGVSAGTTVYFQIIIQNDSGDDTFTFLTPDACNFHITESLDNAGSDLNLNTGDLQADEANFNSLTVQEGSGSGQATIGKTYLGNNAFSNMACLSVNGNDGATNYGFAQVSNGNTIMNAMPSSYNSFRSSNNEIASIGDIGLGIALGIGNTAVFPLEVDGSALFSGVVFANEIDTADALITNISNTNLSGTNATFQEINVSGNLIVNGTTFTTTNLTAGENITISNNVISAFFGSGGQVSLNHIQVDGGVDIGGVLNVSQTSNFSNSVNVGDILYVGESGNHEGSVVIYSNIVGDNLTTKINSSTLEVNCSATGNLSVINFFVGNNKSLEITNSGIEATSIISDDIQVTDITADVLTFIDGRATFRLNTPQMNASNASIDTADIGQINASVVSCDVLETDVLDLDILNVSTLNFSVGVGDELNTSNLNTSNLYADTGNISSLTIDGTTDFPLVVPNGQVNIRQMNISKGLFVQGSDMFIGSPSNASNNFGGPPRSRLNFWSSTKVFDMGTRFGVNENNEAFFSLEPFGDVSNYTISINNFSTMNMTETDTTFNHRLNASNISGDNITADTTTITNANSDFLKTFHFNLSDQGSLGLATTFERTTDTTITSPVGSIIFNTKPNSTARAMIISQNNIVTTRTIQNVGLMETRNFSVDENVSVTSSLTANDMEIMNDVDIYNDLFVANRIDATTVDALDIVGDNGDFGLIDATTINATTINSSTINSSNGNFSGMVVNATGSFQTVVANNVNVAGTLNANNITGYQEELTAGSNISILNNTISAIIEEFPTDANFSSLGSLTYNISDNLDQAEASVLFRDGNVTQLLHSGGRVRFDCNSIETDVGNFSTINVSNTNFSSITADTANISQVNCSSVNVETKLTANRIIGNESIEVGELGTGGADLIFYGPIGGSKMEMELLENDFNLKSSVDNINFKIDNNLKASITQTGLNANIINTDTITGATFNSSFINTSFFSCIDEAGFSGTLNANIISCNEFDTDEAVIGEIRATDNIRSNVYNISDNLDQAEASVLFRDGNVTQLLHSGGRVRFDCNSIETDVGNFSTINSSNLSTASMSFDPTDFNFNNGELSLVGSATLPANANFSSVTATTGNFSTINASNLSTAIMSFSDDFNFSNNTLSLITNDEVNPRFRVVGNQITTTQNKSLLFTNSGVIDFNINGTYYTSSTFKGIYEATIAGTYWVYCKFRLPDDTTTDVEVQWYKKATNGTISTYEPFERWMGTDVTDKRRATTSGALIELQPGEGIFPRNDNGGTINNCVVIFSGYKISTNAGTPSNLNISSVTAEVGNFSTINASNIVGYQETISGGTNINVINNEVSTDANVNFSNVGILTTSTRTPLSISPTDTEPKITLYDGGSTTDHYGFGVSSSQLNYHSRADHVFYYNGKNGDGTELLRINDDGNLISPKFRVFKPVSNLTDRFSSSGGGTLVTVANNVACNGGTLVFHCEVSGFTRAAGVKEFQIRYTTSGGTVRATIPMKFTFNQESVHHSWSRTHVQTGVPAAANNKLQLFRNSTDLRCDANDFINVTIYEMPY